MKQSEPSPPTPDAIVDEVRAIRAKLSARFDNDIDKLCEYLRRKEAEYGDRIVQPGTLTCKRLRGVAPGKRG